MELSLFWGLDCGGGEDICEGNIYDIHGGLAHVGILDFLDDMGAYLVMMMTLYK